VSSGQGTCDEATANLERAYLALLPHVDRAVIEDGHLLLKVGEQSFRFETRTLVGPSG
jgi:hypothetical protein